MAINPRASDRQADGAYENVRTATADNDCGDDGTATRETMTAAGGSWRTECRCRVVRLRSASVGGGRRRHGALDSYDARTETRRAPVGPVAAAAFVTCFVVRSSSASAHRSLYAIAAVRRHRTNRA